MMNKRFFKNSGPFDLAFIATHLSAEMIGPKNHKEKVMVHGVDTLESATPDEIAFLSNVKYEDQLQSTKAAACIVKPEIAQKYSFDNLWLLVHPNPYFAYANLLDLFYSPLMENPSEVAKSAHINPSAKLGKNVTIGHFTAVEAGAEIGDGTVIGSNCYIGTGVRIGSNSRVDSNVTISYAIIGNNVVILPGARIGQDGFGFATEKGKHKKIFHIGTVVIEDDVEIGANTTIDRGALKDTIIKTGARLDNLVQIGHNVEIGVGTILVSQVGIAGSTTIGNYCAFGGQAGVAGHISIVDKTQVAGQAGVQHSIGQAGVYFGTPALPIREWQKQNIAIKKLMVKND